MSADARGRSGLALGSSAALLVGAALALASTAALWPRTSPTTTSTTSTTPAATTPPTTTATTATTATALTQLDALVARVQADDAEKRALLARAKDGERGERLRLLGRAIAKARDVRRAAGQAGPQLKTPFAVDELDLAFLGAGDTRWLITRDGKVVLPAGTASPVDLATAGRDEDARVVDVDAGGVSQKLVRRCLPNEAYCVVDVEAPDAAVGVTVDVDAVRAALRGPATPAPATTAPATSTAATSSTSTDAAPTPLPAIALLALAWGLAVLAIVRLREVGSLVVRAALRLRSGVSGRPTAAGAAVFAEVSELERAIDEAFVALAGKEAPGLARARVHDVVRALDAARGRGDARDARAAVAVSVDDDAVVASLVQATNQLLETLDERARRQSTLAKDVDAALALLPALAERLLRLARLPTLPEDLSDELASLGAAAAEKGKSNALRLWRDDVASVTPVHPDAQRERLAQVASVRDVEAPEVARLMAAESPPADPRPLE